MSILVAEKNAAMLLSDEVVPWDAEVDGVSADSAIAYLMACTVCKPYAPTKPSGRRVMYDKLIGRMRRRIHVSCSWRPHIFKENVGDRFSVDELQAAVDRRYGLAAEGRGRGDGGGHAGGGGGGGGADPADNDDHCSTLPSSLTSPSSSSSSAPSAALAPLPSPMLHAVPPLPPSPPAAANSTVLAPTLPATLVGAPPPSRPPPSPPPEPRGSVDATGGDAQHDAAHALVLMLAATSTAPRSRLPDRDAGSVPSQPSTKGAMSVGAAAVTAAALTSATASAAKLLRPSTAKAAQTDEKSKSGGRRRTKRPPETPEQRKARVAAEKRERAEIERAIREAEGVRRTARSTRPIVESEKEKQARMEAVKKQWRDNESEYARQRSELRRLAGAVTSAVAPERSDALLVGSSLPTAPAVASGIDAPRSTEAAARSTAWPSTSSSPSAPLPSQQDVLSALPSIDEMARAFRLRGQWSDAVSLASVPTTTPTRDAARRRASSADRTSLLVASLPAPLDPRVEAASSSSRSSTRVKRKAADQRDRSMSPSGLSPSSSLSSSSSSSSLSDFSRSPFQIVSRAVPQLASSSSLPPPLPPPTVSAQTVRHSMPPPSPPLLSLGAPTSARHTQAVPIDATPFHAHFGASADARRRRRVRLKTLRDHARRFEVDLEVLTKPADSWSDTESATTSSSSDDAAGDDGDVAIGKAASDADRNLPLNGECDSQHRTARMREISNRLRRLVCASIAF